MKKYIFEWDGHKFYDVASLVEYIIDNLNPRELYELVEDGYDWLKQVRDDCYFKDIIIGCLRKNGKYDFIYTLTCNMLYESTRTNKECNVNKLIIRQIDIHKITEVEE